MSAAARKAAFWRLSETCANVQGNIFAAIERALNSELDSLAETVDIRHLTAVLTEAAFASAKEHGTDRLREALVDCEAERLAAESTVEDLQAQVDELKASNDELNDNWLDAKRQIESLEGEVASLSEDVDAAIQDELP